MLTHAFGERCLATYVILEERRETLLVRLIGRPEQAGPAELRDDPDLLARLQTASSPSPSPSP